VRGIVDLGFVKAAAIIQNSSYFGDEVVWLSMTINSFFFGIAFAAINK